MRRSVLKESERTYRRGIKEYLNGRADEAFESLKESFYSRLSHSESESDEFKAFFSYQLSCYFMSKETMAISLQEGDMVSDLIQAKYHEIDDYCSSSPFRITLEGRLNLLENAEMLFPAENASIFEEEVLERVSK